MNHRRVHYVIYLVKKGVLTIRMECVDDSHGSREHRARIFEGMRCSFLPKGILMKAHFVIWSHRRVWTCTYVSKTRLYTLRANGATASHSDGRVVHGARRECLIVVFVTGCAWGSSGNYFDFTIGIRSEHSRLWSQALVDTRHRSSVTEVLAGSGTQRDVCLRIQALCLPLPASACSWFLRMHICWCEALCSLVCSLLMTFSLMCVLTVLLRDVLSRRESDGQQILPPILDSRSLYRGTSSMPMHMHPPCTQNRAWRKMYHHFEGIKDDTTIRSKGTVLVQQRNIGASLFSSQESCPL